MVEGPSSLLDRAYRLAYVVAYSGLRLWWMIRRPEVHGAFVAVWHDEHVLLIRNSYRRSETLPSGFIGRRESAREAARRELFEEVGLAVEPDALLPADTLTHRVHGKLDHAHFFDLVLDEAPALRVDGREVLSAEFCDPAEVERRSLPRHVREHLRRRLARMRGGDGEAQAAAGKGAMGTPR